mmetsp:Transcript_22726/g.40346  ORF Transcript_22726/g.40346 Transcript_22726/m.40346 type:complete len:218 (+) Transcript_22726:93-746(+)
MNQSSETMLHSSNKSQECCTCLPYNDGLLITAQLLSILAVLLSWANAVTFVLGVVSFVCLQIVWCCRMGKCGLISVGVFAMISGICSVIVGILILSGGVNALCIQVADDIDGQGDDDTLTIHVDGMNTYDFHRTCSIGLNTFVGLALTGGALWLVISLCIFIFSCGSRYEAYYSWEQENSNEDETIMVKQQQQVSNNKVGPQQQSRTVSGVVTGDKV